ncbi:hypothetical protein [Amycolatopsis sp. cmx-4-68]|uniref:hypothetical protein n=1 Tax=Amycolatopsis sp. cmx-4-68 TaxID=2790938 RepID=UPI00397A9DF4
MTRLLTGPDGTIAAHWHPLQEHLKASTKPAAVLKWLRGAPAARLLRELVSRGQPVTHTLLDSVPPTSAVHYLRDLLVNAGVLSARDGEYLHRIAPWLQALLADAPPHHAPTLASFTRWYLRPKARRSAARRGVGDATPTTIPTKVLAASRLLDWLDTLHLVPNQATLGR